MLLCYAIERHASLRFQAAMTTPDIISKNRNAIRKRRKSASGYFAIFLFSRRAILFLARVPHDAVSAANGLPASISGLKRAAQIE